MPEITWVDDVPMPAMSEDDYNESSENYEDSDWWNDPNCVMSRHHYWIMKYQITSIQFDCSLDDTEDWDESDQIMTEERLSDVYVGQFWDDDEEDLIEEISCASGWCVKSIDYRIILKWLPIQCLSSCIVNAGKIMTYLLWSLMSIWLH